MSIEGNLTPNGRGCLKYNCVKRKKNPLTANDGSFKAERTRNLSQVIGEVSAIAAKRKSYLCNNNSRNSIGNS